MILVSVALADPCDQYFTDAAKRPLHRVDEIVRSGLADYPVDKEMAEIPDIQAAVEQQYPGMVDHNRKNEKYLRKTLGREIGRAHV